MYFMPNVWVLEFRCSQASGKSLSMAHVIMDHGVSLPHWQCWNGQCYDKSWSHLLITWWTSCAVAADPQPHSTTPTPALTVTWLPHLHLLLLGTTTTTGADTGFPERGGGQDIHKHPPPPLGHCPRDVIRTSTPPLDIVRVTSSALKTIKYTHSCTFTSTPPWTLPVWRHPHYS